MESVTWALGLKLVEENTMNLSPFEITQLR